MRLTGNQSRQVLSRFGVYVTEACDRCSQLLGPVRFTRRGDTGTWCSGECRGDGEQRPVRRGGRPRKYATEDARQKAEQLQNAERQREFRTRVQRNGKPSRSFAKTKDLEGQKSPLSHYPLTQPLLGLERAANAKWLGILFALFLGLCSGGPPMQYAIYFRLEGPF